MSRAQEIQDLLLRAGRLENEAIATAESHIDTRDWPRRALADITHAELKLKVAAVLRDRARSVE